MGEHGLNSPIDGDAPLQLISDPNVCHANLRIILQKVKKSSCSQRSPARRHLEWFKIPCGKKFAQSTDGESALFGEDQIMGLNFFWHKSNAESFASDGNRCFGRCDSVRGSFFWGFSSDKHHLGGCNWHAVLTRMTVGTEIVSLTLFLSKPDRRVFGHKLNKFKKALSKVDRSKRHLV